MEGLVLRVNPEHNTMLVSHQAIPNYMQAMVMPFRVRRPQELNLVRPGSRVAFQLVVRKSESFAERVRARDNGNGVLEDQGDRIEIAALPEKLANGAEVPDFALTDQTNHSVRLTDFRGKLVVIDFIYTRCPLPDVCPRLSANFARFQRRFHGQMGREIVLLSITIDPQYDTPEVLARYAKIWKADPAAWHFLTGDARQIQAVAGRFGMHYWPEEGLITHTSQTAIVEKDGRLAALVEGPGYTAEELGDLIASRLEG